MKIEFAKSLSGHDKNEIYVITKKEGQINGKQSLRNRRQC